MVSDRDAEGLDGQAAGPDGRAATSAAQALAAARENFQTAQDAQRNGDAAAALQAYGRTITADPSHASAFTQIGIARLRHGDFVAAEAALRRALAIDPSDALAHATLGTALRRLRRPRDASMSLSRALKIDPEAPEYHIGLALALRDLGLCDEAQTGLERALGLAAGHPAMANLASLERAQTQLLAGDLKGGFARLAEHFEQYGSAERGFNAPMWDGSDPGGKSILLHGNDKLKEYLMFGRFAAELAARGATVSVECPAPMIDLLMGMEGLAQVLPRGDVVPRTDFHAPLLALPHLLGTDYSSLGKDVPYFLPSRQGVSRVGRTAGRNLHVGIAWSSREAELGTFERLELLERFLGLLRIPGVVLHSLQRRQHVGDIQTLGAAELVRDTGTVINSLVDTAGILRDLDLLICVDTAAAHLAGAMGRPVWLLVPYAPEWRWMLDRQDSPWYPTMRLFRQTAPGDWRDTFRNVAEALREKAPPSPARALATAAAAAGIASAPALQEDDHGAPRHREADASDEAEDTLATDAPKASDDAAATDQDVGDLEDEEMEFATLELPEDDDAPDAGTSEPEPADAFFDEMHLADAETTLTNDNGEALDTTTDAEAASSLALADGEEPEFVELELAKDEGLLDSAGPDGGADRRDTEIALDSGDDDGFPSAAEDTGSVQDGDEPEFAELVLPDDDGALDYGDPGTLAAVEDALEFEIAELASSAGVENQPVSIAEDGAETASEDFVVPEMEFTVLELDDEEDELKPHALDPLTAIESALEFEASGGTAVGVDPDTFTATTNEEPEFAELELPDDDGEPVEQDNGQEEAQLADLVFGEADPLEMEQALSADAEQQLVPDPDVVESVTAPPKPHEEPAEEIDFAGLAADEVAEMLGETIEDTTPGASGEEPFGTSSTGGGPEVAASEDGVLDSADTSDAPLLDPSTDDEDQLAAIEDAVSVIAAGAGGLTDDLDLDDDADDLGEIPGLGDDSDPITDSLEDDDETDAVFGETLTTDSEDDEPLLEDPTGAIDLDDTDSPDAVFGEKLGLEEGAAPSRTPTAIDEEGLPDPVEDPAIETGVADLIEGTEEVAGGEPPTLAEQDQNAGDADLGDGSSLPLPSASLGDDGQPRFFMSVRQDDLGDEDIVDLCRQEADYGGYLAAVRRFLDDHLTPGDAFIDIGAHWGVITLTAASLYPGEVRVLAIEPNPDNWRRLGQWLDENNLTDTVEIIGAAVSAETGVGLMRPAEGSMRHALVGVAGADSAEVDDYEVPLTTVDDVIAGRPDLQNRRVILRISAEGLEPEILAGARELLASGRVAAILTNRGPAFDFEPRRSRLFDVLEDLEGLSFDHYRLPHDIIGGTLSPFVYGMEICTIFSLSRTLERWQSYDRALGGFVPAPRPSSTTLPAEARAEWTELLRETGGTDVGRWADPVNLEEGSRERAAAAAPFIPENAQVLDLGAGLGRLRDQLPPGCGYAPLDLVARFSDSLIYDLNQGQLPAEQCDVAVMLEVLEFLHDPGAMLSSLRERAGQLVLSYAPDVDGDVEQRRVQGWFNDYSEDELRDLLVATGWHIDNETTAQGRLFLSCSAA